MQTKNECIISHASWTKLIPEGVQEGFLHVPRYTILHNWTRSL